MKKSTLLLLVCLLCGNSFVDGMKRKRPPGDDPDKPSKKRKLEEKARGQDFLALLQQNLNDEDAIDEDAIIEQLKLDGFLEKLDQTFQNDETLYCYNCPYSTKDVAAFQKHIETCDFKLKGRKKSNSKKTVAHNLDEFMRDFPSIDGLAIDGLGDDLGTNITYDLDLDLDLDLGIDLGIDQLREKLYKNNNGGMSTKGSSMKNGLWGLGSVRPVNPIEFPVTYNETEQWPAISAEARIREDSGSIRDDRHQMSINGNRSVARNVNFNFTIAPSLSQKDGSLDCGFHALFNAVCFLTENSVLMIESDRLKNLLEGWKKKLGQLGMDTTNLTSTQMEEIIRQDDFFAPLRNQDGSLRNNVSIVDSLGVGGLENAFRNARHDEYEIDADRLSLLGDDIDRLEKGEQPRSLRLVGHHEEWRYTPTVLQNIRRFRWNGESQIIVVNIGGHWIAIKLFCRDERDCMVIADSLYNDLFGFNHLLGIARRIYNLFRTDPLPTPTDLPPPLESLEDFLKKQ